MLIIYVIYVYRQLTGRSRNRLLRKGKKKWTTDFAYFPYNPLLDSLEK